MASLEITDDQLQQVITGAIVAHFDEKQREGILKDAIMAILNDRAYVVSKGFDA